VLWIGVDGIVQHMKANPASKRNYIVFEVLRANVYYDHAVLYAEVFFVLPFEVSEGWEVKVKRYFGQTPRRARV
jgi:hypothetical protein